MTNEEIIRIALAQSALDLGCDPEDFLKDTPTVVNASHPAGMRRYYADPIQGNIVSYGSGVVASVAEPYKGAVEKYIRSYPFYHLFVTPNLYRLNEDLAPLGSAVCFMAEYFLPDLMELKALSCPFQVKLLSPEDFKELYKPEWTNALCRDRKELDVIGIGAYDGDRLIGLAGASADCDSMWQIGVDVLPPYRRRGVASALTSRLALEILALGKVPFYCAAWSNIRSTKNAIRSGFRPAWVEISLKPLGTISEMNEKSVPDETL